MNKRYEFLKDDFIEVNGEKLYRIRALRDFNDVKAGELGGYVGVLSGNAQDSGDDSKPEAA